MRTWIVTYLVKFSEEWCADECSWIEHSSMIEALSAKSAQIKFRSKHMARPRFIIGRHISTRQVRP